MIDRPQPEEAALRSAMTRIARGGTANLAGAALSGVSGFVLVVLVTRLYDAETAGSLFAAISAFLILVAIVELGVDQGFVRFIAWYRARGRSAHIPALLRIGYLPVLGAAMAASGVGLGLAGPLAEIVGGEDTTRVATIMRVLSCAIPVAAAYDVTLAATRGHGTIRPTALIEGVVRPVLQPLAVVAAAALDAGVVGLAVAWCAPYGIGLVLAAAALERTRQAPSGSSAPPRERRILARRFWSFTAPRGIGRVCQVALQRADILIVATLRGPRDAAVYTAATRFLVLGQAAVQAVQQVLQPKLAELLAVENRDLAEAVFKRATAWFVALSWPLYLLLVAFAEPVVGIFGDSYQAGAAGLVVLSLAMLVATAAGPVDVLLLMAGRSGLSLLNTVVSLGVDVGLCFLLVPDHGVLGAAIAWAAAILVRNALGVVQVRQQLGMTAWGSEFTRAVLTTLLSFGAIPLLLSPIVDEISGVLVVSAVCAAGYGLLLWRAREALGLGAFAALTPAVVTSNPRFARRASERQRENART